MFKSSDQQLIDKALSGSERAWCKLVRRYQNEIYNHAYRMTGSSSDASDLMQEIFLAIFRNLPGFRGDAKFRTWIYRIASNRSIDYLRKKKPEIADFELDSLSDGLLLSDNLHQWQQNKIILNLLSLIPDEQRVVIELKFFQQFTFVEIASQLGISVNTAKTRMYSALDRLKKLAGDDHVQAACL